MPGPAKSGLFIYAKDLNGLANFYESVLGLRRIHASSDLVVLQSNDMQLVVHAMPPEVASNIVIASPPAPRWAAALKFFFTVPSIDAARAHAAGAGGGVMVERYQGPGFVACNAYDSEGNVFHVREPAA